jgi:hypothetical protein
MVFEAFKIISARHRITLSIFQYIGVLVIGILVYWLLGLVKFLRLVKSLMLLKLLGVVGVVEVS